MNRIEEIYANYVSSDEYIGFYVTDNFREDLKEKIGLEAYREISDEIVKFAGEAEEGGFINGFKYAVSLLKECI